jgi:hypothetical protein
LCASECPLVVMAACRLLARFLPAPARAHRSGLRSNRVSRSSSLLCPVLTSARRSVRLAANPDTACAVSPSRSPEISHSTFPARPPSLRCRALIDMDFAAICPLVRPSRLSAGSCSLARSFAPRFFQTRPHGRALALRYPSPQSGWEKDFHLPGCVTCSAYK